VEREKKMMSLELFEKIIPQVAPLTDQVTLHLMGDPLVHPKLQEFVIVCATHQVPIFLVTNGVLLNNEKAEILLHPIVRQVNFSLHSFHDNYGDKDPSVYLSKIFQFTEKAFSERPDLYINYRLWNLAEPIGTGAQNKSLLDRVFQHFQLSSEASEAQKHVNVRSHKSLRMKDRLYLHFDTEFTWPALDLPVLGSKGTCYGLSQHFGILADGTVVPCCLDKEGALPLGKVQDAPILEILGSARAQAILKGFKENKLIEALCQRCNYITRFQ
jgi:sulfatase maturation enzyme AslB (radical SAM superfamily)